MVVNHLAMSSDAKSTRPEDLGVFDGILGSVLVEEADDFFVNFSNSFAQSVWTSSNVVEWDSNLTRAEFKRELSLSTD